jgi:hypothetical protein
MEDAGASWAGKMFLLREHQTSSRGHSRDAIFPAAATVDVVFDDPNLIADARLVPMISLAEQIGLPELVAEFVTITDAVNSAGANPAAKVMSLVAGIVAGADSIEDVDRLRYAGNPACVR